MLQDHVGDGPWEAPASITPGEDAMVPGSGIAAWSCIAVCMGVGVGSVMPGIPSPTSDPAMVRPIPLPPAGDRVAAASETSASAQAVAIYTVTDRLRSA